MSAQRRVVVAMSDIHAGHKLGLMNPAVILPNEDEHGNPRPYTPRPTAMQKWLWECYTEDVAKALEIADGCPVTLIVNGDVTWGNKHPSGLVSTREYDQIAIAISDLAPWGMAPNVKQFRLIHGTQSHEFGEGTAPELVARYLKVQLPGRDIRTLRHGLFTIAGVTFDAAHHRSGPGSRAWLSGTVLQREAKSIMISEIMADREPPRVILGSHFHTYIHETVRQAGHGKRYVTDAILTPSYCGMTHYATQVTRSSYMLGCGLVVFVIDGSRLGIYPQVRETDLRSKETL